MKMQSKTMMQPTAAKKISLTVWRMYNKEKTGLFCEGCCDTWLSTEEEEGSEPFLIT